MSSVSALRTSSLVSTDDLAHPECSLVSWHRSIPGDVTLRLEAWSRDDSRFECTLSQPAAPRAALWGLPPSTRHWLERDFLTLTQRLFDLPGTREVTFKFGVVASDQCRKFHVDYLRYRLITTYVGPGTEWLPNAEVNRQVLRDPPEDADVANARIIACPTAVQCAVAGDVLLMKGARHAHGLGLVHRSPPIENRGGPRIVLVLSVR